MDRTKLTHSIPAIMFLMALALIGLPFVKFLFVCVVTVVVGAALFYAFLGFMYGADKIIDYFYTARYL